MKQKRLFALGAILLTGITAISLVGCGDTGNTGNAGSGNKNPYEISASLGYEGSDGEFLTSVTEQKSELKLLYEEAKEAGYEKSYLDFLKEYGISSSSATASVNRAVTSSVSIVCEFTKITYTQGWFGGGTQKHETTVTSAGSGVIYSLNKEAGDAYVITNYHVVCSSESGVTEKICLSPVVYLYGSEITSRAMTAEYVGGAMDYDIAVLKIEGNEFLKNSAARAVTVGDSDAVTVGETAYAVGNAKGEGTSVSRGVVSVLAEYIDIESADGSKKINLLEMRTDAPINHGNSGGGLYNEAGQLIGIVNAKYEDSGVDGIGYAIPANLAIPLAQNIIDNSKTNSAKGAMRATLGITVQVTDSKAVYDETYGKTYVMETITVQEVTGSAVSGKVKANDVVYSVRINDGEKKIVTRLHMVTNTLFDVRKGDTVTLELYRDGTLETVTISFTEDAQFTLYH